MILIEVTESSEPSTTTILIYNVEHDHEQRIQRENLFALASVKLLDELQCLMIHMQIMDQFVAAVQEYHHRAEAEKIKSKKSLKTMLEELRNIVNAQQEADGKRFRSDQY